MLNIHEVKAHNHKVALKASDKLIDRLDPIMIVADEERRAKRLAKRNIPTCKPDERAPRKIYMGGKRATGATAHNARSAMPAQNYMREYLRGERS
jgi:hypothetical protein